MENMDVMSTGKYEVNFFVFNTMSTFPSHSLIVFLIVLV